MGSVIGISSAAGDGELARMQAAVAHRGQVCKAISLAAGGLMAGACGDGESRAWAMQDWMLVGEADVFNKNELLAYLQSQGVEPESADSCALVLAVWATGGADALDLINGDFAVAIADVSGEQLFLARDRCGARPLYYTWLQDRWLFASEYKAFLGFDGFDRTVDKAAMSMLHARKVVPADASLFESVRQVPSQSFVRLTRDGQAAVSRYVRSRHEIRKSSLADSASRISEAFLGAMERRMLDGGTIGLSLSGGVDSVAMAFAARRCAPDRRMATYSIGDSADDPELTVAARVADAVGAEHHSLVFSNDRLADRMQALAWSLEDPIARTESLMTQDICNAAASDVQVMLRGDGADGLFGGMARHKILALAERVPVAAWLLKDVYSYSQTGRLPANILSRMAIKAYFRSSIPEPPEVLGYKPAAPSLIEFEGHRELLNHVLQGGARHALPMLLQKVERPHAASGMRTLSPFLDKDLVAAAHSIPSLMKNNGQRNKIVFREAVRNFVPEEFVRLPKYAQRVRESSEFCDALEAVVVDGGLADSLIARNVFDSASVRKLLVRRAGAPWPPEHAMRIWTLALTEMWFRLFVDGDSPVSG